MIHGQMIHVSGGREGGARIFQEGPESVPNLGFRRQAQAHRLFVSLNCRLQSDEG